MWRSINANKLLVWLLLSAATAINIWLFSQVFRYFEHLITILVISAIVAFLLNYPVRFLDRAGISRSQAVFVVLVISLVLIVVLGVTVVPSVIEQVAGLSEQVPKWIQGSNQNINNLEQLAQKRGLRLDFNVLRTQINSNLQRQIEGFASQVVTLAVGTASGLLDFFLIIVLSVYMLIDGDKMWNGVIKMLPPPWGYSLGEALRMNFQRFFISQFLLGGFMALALTIIFFFLNVPFGLSFAIFIGISQLIPFVGATLGIGIVTLLVLLKSLPLALWVGGTSFVLQQIKDNFLAPKLMGDFIGLNPVMILLAVLVGLQTAGFLGVLVGVPIAGTIKSTIDMIRQSRKEEELALATGEEH
jgi:predicted PurR-regulated permease PerM